MPLCKIITVAGQIGNYEDGHIDALIEDQVPLAFENLRKCLSSAGATPRDVMKVRARSRYHIVDFDFANRKPSELYAKFMDGHDPLITLISVEKLALLYEIEVMAIVALGQEGKSK